jgi:hypothetical protein
MSLDFYDVKGAPVAYSDDGEHIYTFSGRPVAYLHDGSVYSFAGTHLGRFANGLVRDNDGNAVFFSEGASGGPLKPLRQLKPLKGLKQLMPLKGLRGLRPLKPLDSLSWSGLSGEHFFD